MKHLSAILILLLAVPASADVLWVKFSPEDDCTGAIVAAFDKATKSIEVQAYNFTSPVIADAAIRAHKRGLPVTLLLDKRAQSTRYSQATRCKQAGCKVYLDGSHPIAHNKVRIIDGKLLLSGSFNDSRAASRNAENLYAEDDPATVKRYAENFARHLKHAEAM